MANTCCFTLSCRSRARRLRSSDAASRWRVRTSRCRSAPSPSRCAASAPISSGPASAAACVKSPWLQAPVTRASRSSRPATDRATGTPTSVPTTPAARVNATRLAPKSASRPADTGAVSAARVTTSSAPRSARPSSKIGVTSVSRPLAGSGYQNTVGARSWSKRVSGDALRSDATRCSVVSRPSSRMRSRGRTRKAARSSGDPSGAAPVAGVTASSRAAASITYSVWTSRRGKA